MMSSPSPWRLRAALAMLPCLWAGMALAQDSGGGPLGALGPMFRPQSAPVGSAAPVAGGAPARQDGGDSGLRMVMLKGSQSFAVIDGRTVRIGDRLNEMRVSRIDHNGVLLVGDGGARQELVFAPALKKRADDASQEKSGVRP